MKRLLLVVLMTVGAVLAADVTGNWVFEVQVDAGSGSPSFTFKQEGEKLTGVYSGLVGEAKLTGTVKGDDIEFTFPVEFSGEKFTVKYWGRMDGATGMKGKLEMGPLGGGTFTGKKK